MTTLDERITVLDRKITTRLSLVVALTDNYTGKQPIGDVKVLFEGHQLEAIKNHSGYYLFLNLPDGEYTVRVESEYYFESKAIVKISNSEPLEPLVVNITLLPVTLLPFSIRIHIDQRDGCSGFK